MTTKNPHATHASCPMPGEGHTDKHDRYHAHMAADDDGMPVRHDHGTSDRPSAIGNLGLHESCPARSASGVADAAMGFGT